MFKVTKVGGARSLDPKPVFQVRPLKRKGGAKKLGIAQAKTIKRKVFNLAELVSFLIQEKSVSGKNFSFSFLDPLFMERSLVALAVLLAWCCYHCHGATALVQCQPGSASMYR
jgi:hypothetical protein